MIPLETLTGALALVLTADVLLVILASAAYGLVLGAVPGLSATMATALLVPLTVFMAPVPAMAAIVTTAAMAIFASDIPAALLRIPGTPASAAYVDDLSALARRGRVGRALGLSLTASALGGVLGALALMLAAPRLALVSLQFTSFEYLWLALLGVSAAVLLGRGSVLKSLIALGLGLLLACVGLDTTAGLPRFTFGEPALLGGIPLVPALIGLFAVPELIRTLVHRPAVPPVAPVLHPARLFRGLPGVLWRRKASLLRSGVLGTGVGILPGAGADIAAWIAYAVSKRAARRPESYGAGSEEGVADACAANNAALCGAHVPAMVFGIPGDSITAIVIGVLTLKGLNPGPTVFLTQPETMTAIFLVFVLANLLIVPLGLVAIALSAQVLRAPRLALAPLILAACVAGSYAIDASAFGIAVMVALGGLAYVMEETGFPVAPAVLGLVMGPVLERALVTSLIKADGDPLAFVDRPIAAGLAVVVALAWTAPLLARRRRRMTF
ncbi:tripartite tricarboxylate transporter permease [Roseospira navarrensis]|uniref:C4-dicarboxylate ABC transporter permease n=1 Tax=Roseospira navarrensis TaxID=140058 RepID=A0A7X2D5C4_9PROT|nr:tripartite tricarboxylate transporter permease [Roseospira navarrensis]MQX37045.1 C4-dicarboxylate ABC transporter permease [Roseospira navarrensis]